MELNKLMSIEEKIEMGFIALAKLEVSGLLSSFEYEETIRTINELIRNESILLKSLSSDDIVRLRNQIGKFCNTRESSFSLGHLANASYHRLLNLLNTLLESKSFDYGAYLRYDLNQIIFSFLECLINNEAYDEIRGDLIFYKYNLIFMNYLSEDDFIKTRNISTISIESKSFKTDSNPDLIFVDKAILVLEGREHVDVIEKYGDDFRENANSFALVLISILELLARLVLSENDILSFLQQDFNYLLESDSVSLEVKNLIGDMISLLEEIKTKIDVAR